MHSVAGRTLKKSVGGRGGKEAFHAGKTAKIRPTAGRTTGIPSLGERQGGIRLLGEAIHELISPSLLSDEIFHLENQLNMADVGGIAPVIRLSHACPGLLRRRVGRQNPLEVAEDVYVWLTAEDIIAIQSEDRQHQGDVRCVHSPVFVCRLGFAQCHCRRQGLLWDCRGFLLGWVLLVVPGFREPLHFWLWSGVEERRSRHVKWPLYHCRCRKTPLLIKLRLNICSVMACRTAGAHVVRTYTISIQCMEPRCLIVCSKTPLPRVVRAKSTTGSSRTE